MPSMMIWWKLVPQCASANATSPMMERMMKPGISAEKERDTEAGTLSGKLITQLRRTMKANISATASPITIPEMMLAPPSQLAPTA